MTQTNTATSKKYQSSWPLIKRLVRDYVRPYTSSILIAVLFMVISAAMTAIFAQLIQPVLDDVIMGGKTKLIWPMAAAVFGCFFIRGIATYFHTFIMNKTGQSIVADIQTKLFSRFVALDLAFFHSNPSGTLTARVVNDVNVVRNAVTSGLTGFGKSFLTLLFLLVVMFMQDWQLTLISVILMPVAGVFVAWIGRRLRKVSKKIQEQFGDLTTTLGEIFQGIRQVKAYGMESFEQKRASSAIQILKKHVIKGEQISNLSTPFNETLVGAAMMGLIVYGGHQVAAGELTPGSLMSFIAAFSLAYEPMKRLAKLNNTIQMGLGAAERIFDMLDRRAEITDRRKATQIKAKKPDIVFEGINFSYGDTENYALKDVSLHIPSGQVTALVGPSGGGKSTIMNMVLRFYDAQSGTVKISGIDIKEIKIDSLRKNMALVSQDITIFDDSASANIAYGNKKASQKEIEKAAKAAAAHEFITKLPQGYKTRLGEGGVKLSGGQKQRIALARAILRNAPILLLDEATSALDTESEKAIQRSLSRFQKGRTVLVVAHRLSTVQHADKIIVMDQGKVVEQGSHATLIKKRNGLYARLYNAGLQD